MSIAMGSLSEAEQKSQLRRAVVASTIGTSIEWYDFFVYGTAAGLVFPKLFFPGSDPLTGTLQSFGIYAVGFVARPVGAAIFGHYGDRIGRKATLIATLLLMGIATFLVAFVPGYASIGIWGAVILTVLRFVQGVGVGGEWGGSVLLAMEWARTHGSRGLVALAAVRRALRPVSLQPRHARVQCHRRRPVPRLGLARAVRAQHRAGRRRPVDPARHPGDAGVPPAGDRAQDRARADPGSDPQAAEGDRALRLAAPGRAGAVLHLHRLRVRLRDRHAARCRATLC